MTTFQEILDRLLEDQETEHDNRLCGQFGRNRDKSVRAAVQRDGEPLEEKPELYMTFNAVQCLKYLYAAITESTENIPHRAELEARRDRIAQGVDRAGEFAERLLLQHSDAHHYIRMREPLRFTAYDEFISYRHTIGAAIILRLLNRQPDLERQLLERLLTAPIQNHDGGWPIADGEKYKNSDILCSAHAAFLFRLALQSGRCSHLRDALTHKINSTVAYLTLEAERNKGFWIYEHELGGAPFTARTYPEVHGLLLDVRSPLVSDIPRNLATRFPLPENHPFTIQNSKKTGIRNGEQFVVRAAYALKTAAVSEPDEFLEKYARLRYAAISNYTDARYYETYDLCCLLIMMVDRFVPDTVSRLKELAYLSEPIVEGLPFVGKPFRVAREVYKRLRTLGYLQ